jgi:hypothetical protein
MKIIGHKALCPYEELDCPIFSLSTPFAAIPCSSVPRNRLRYFFLLAPKFHLGALLPEALLPYAIIVKQSFTRFHSKAELWNEMKLNYPIFLLQPFLQQTSLILRHAKSSAVSYVPQRQNYQIFLNIVFNTMYLQCINLYINLGFARIRFREVSFYRFLSKRKR